MRETAGALSLKAAKDTTKYDGREVAEAQMYDISVQLLKSAKTHEPIFDEPEFCVVMVRASDPLIKGVVRQKYYSYPYLPSPRPEQAVFLYTKSDQSIKFLWSLPPAKVMAALSECPWANVGKMWKRTKIWVDAFYKLKFWETIRELSVIDMLSESEYLAIHREELVKSGCKQPDSGFSESFDFSKVMMEKVINPNEVIANKNILNSSGQA